MSRYEGRIKVVGVDLMCFAADPETLDPLTVSCYDAYALTDPEPGPVQTISIAEWHQRRARKRRRDAEARG